jgi:hypothetical protein
MFVEQIDIVVVCKLLDALDKYSWNTSCEIWWKVQILWMCCAFLSLSNSMVVHQACGHIQCKFKRLLLNEVMITGPRGCVNTEEHSFARVWDKKESVPVVLAESNHLGPVLVLGDDQLCSCAMNNQLRETKSEVVTRCVHWRNSHPKSITVLLIDLWSLTQSHSSLTGMQTAHSSHYPSLDVESHSCPTPNSY